MKYRIPGLTSDKKAVRIASTILLVLVILQTLLALFLTPVTRAVLSSTLVPETNVKRLYINLFGGSIRLRGLQIKQPEGFGDGSFVSLGRADLNLSIASLLMGRLKVSDLVVQDLAVSIITESNGVMNVTQLTEPAEEKVEAKPDAKDSKPSGPVIRIGKIQVERLSVTIINRSKIDERPMELNLRHAGLTVDDLLIDPGSDVKELLTTALFNGQFEYADTPASYIGLSARLGPITAGAPAAIASLIISGIELDALGSLIPPGAALTLGGDVMDVEAKLRVNPKMLDVQANVVTAGATFPVNVSGTPDDYDLEADKVLLGAFGRLGGIVGNTVSDVASAGLAVGKGAVDVASTVGSGAVEIVGGLGKGLLNTAKSVATLDVKGIATNLTGTVVDASQGAVNTISQAGSTAVSTVGDAGKATFGDGRAAEWRAKKRERHADNWAAAQSWVAAEAYPAQDNKHSSNPVE